MCEVVFDNSIVSNTLYVLYIQLYFDSLSLGGDILV